MWPACCHWPDTGRVDARCPIMSVLTQSYQCGTWFVCSILQELAVSNLGQPLFCLSITWSRCRNAYRDLWIMIIMRRSHLGNSSCIKGSFLMLVGCLPDPILSIASVYLAFVYLQMIQYTHYIAFYAVCHVCILFYLCVYFLWNDQINLWYTTVKWAWLCLHFVCFVAMRSIRCGFVWYICP